MRHGTPPTICALLLTAAACGGGGTEPPGPPAAIRAVSPAPGPFPIATDALDSLVARVVDEAGRGVANASVRWATDAGTVSTENALTDGRGNARTAWSSAPKTGPQTITASIAISAAASSVSFPVTVVSPLALGFDGIDDYVQLPNSASLGAGTGDFTWEIRLRRAFAGTRQDVLTKKDAFADSEHDVAIVIEDDGRVTAFLRDSPFRSTVQIRSRTSIGSEWTHIAMVRARGIVSLYVDGTLESSGSAPFDVTSTGPLRIGANRLNNAGPDAPPVFPFAGLVQEVRIWNVALTGRQIADANSRCVPRSQAGLVADLRFDEGTGITVRDASANGNQGTVRGGAAWAAGPRRCTA